MDKRTNNWGLIGAVGTAVAGSVCCLGPLLLVSLGASGAWIGSLGALETYRPIFMTLSLGLLGFVFYRAYRPQAQACEPGTVCAQPTTQRITKLSLWVVSVAVAALFASPYVIGQVAAGMQDTTPTVPAVTKTATLQVDGMTCAACPATVRKSLTRLDGVVNARVSFDPPHAIVEFDPAKVAPDQLTAATDAVGYPSKLISTD